MKYISPSWDHIHILSVRVAKKILKSSFQPEVIVGIFRGGWVAAKLISDTLGVYDLASIEIKFYVGVGETSKKPVLTVPLLKDVRGKNVLVVDDVADTGRTLQLAIETVNLYGPKTLRSATLYLKPRSIITPDYYGEVTDAWIIFPWEIREVLEELALKRNMKSLEGIINIAKEVGISNEEILHEISEIILSKLTTPKAD